MTQSLSEKSTGDWTDFLLHLTTEPGIYRMLDADARVLYVGKAANLKKRVSSYFNKANQGVKTRVLLQQIASIDVQVTRSETEALLLESSLIKSLQPKYNVLLRDDKSYPFIHISHAHPYPRPEIIRCKKKPQKGDFFGPYPSVTAVRDALTALQKVFKLRNCSDTYFSHRTRPCLQYQLQRCSAPCTSYISVDDYQRSLSAGMHFLQGKSQQMLDEWANRMEDAVSRLAFEEAALLRDQMKQLRLVQEQQGVVAVRGDIDIIVMDVQPSFACVQCVSVREGDIINSQSFFPSVPKTVVWDEDDNLSLTDEVFAAFVAYYYVETPERIPAEILTPHVLADKASLQAMLSVLCGKKGCRIQTTFRGSKSGWLDFARNNLQRAVIEHRATKEQKGHQYQALGEVIGIATPIARMECFDISHTQGDDTVASCVVFDVHGPCKRDYRRFNIQGITPGDDYAAMEQALTRRFQSKSAPLPELLIIDGGKGQVGVAKRVLQHLGLDSVYVLGIAKGPTRKAGWEHLILADEAIEKTLPIDSVALHLLQHIRDEAHRFAITAHRKKRQKTSLSSSLDDIEGIGPKRRQALLRRFGGVRELAKVSVDELIKVSGINYDLAQRIYRHFHPESYPL